MHIYLLEKKYIQNFFARYLTWILYINFSVFNSQNHFIAFKNILYCYENYGEHLITFRDTNLLTFFPVNSSFNVGLKKDFEFQYSYFEVEEI